MQDVRDLLNLGPGLSMTMLEKALSLLRPKLKVPTIRKIRAERDENVGWFFRSKVVELQYGKKYDMALTPSVVVYCAHVTSYLTSWLGERAKKPLRLKLMADFGQTSLKVGVLPIDFSSNSSAHMQLLIVSTAPESCHNFRSLLQSEEVRQLMLCHNVQIVVDLKAMLEIIGIMAGTYRCGVCKWKQGDGFECGCELRTFEDQLSNWNTLQTTYHGNSKKFASKCSGVEAKPFIDHPDFLWQFPPPALHLLLGILQKCYDAIIKRMQETERKAHELKLQLLGIKKSKYFGGCFEGNECRKILKNLDATGLNANADCLPIYKVLEAFNEVVESCFGMTRTTDYKEKIRTFKEAWIEAKDQCPDMTITSKAHYVVDHVPAYLEKYEAEGVGLGLISEQAIEHSHHCFKGVWDLRYKRSEPRPIALPEAPAELAELSAAGAPAAESLVEAYNKKMAEFGRNLLKCTVQYNWQRLAKGL